MPASPAKTSAALIVTTPADREIVLKRVFDAPRSVVFEALTKPEHLLRWYGPRSSPLVACELDSRVGGAWRFLLRGSNGRDMRMNGVYQEITPPERIVSTEGFDDYPGAASLNTLTLTEQNGKTTLQVSVLYPSNEVRNAVIRSGMEQGAGETYDRLAEHLATLSTPAPQEFELVITRSFQAPRELVFECWTKPEHLQHWQGAPRGFTVTAQHSDIRPGGSFEINMRSPDGQDHGLRGSYREIVPPERIVFTHVWLNADGKPGRETLVTVTLVERNGKTELTLRQTGFTSVESRDGHRDGWMSALDVLADYLAEYKVAR